jgi:5'-3' exonuclease
MGIPHYYKHIITSYKFIIKDKIPTCDRLYIDFNSVIHQCAAAVVNETPNYTHQSIIDHIIKETDIIIKKMNPTQLVFIGIDGVAPRAKMVQQRKRRYLTAYKNEVIREVYQRNMLPPPPDWDSNIITPGTSFMKELDIQLKAHYANQATPYRVIISGSDEKGEGEQKLFDHMRQQTPAVNVINGLDADLIMLSLLSSDDIYLQRDAETFVDIAEFRRCISHHVNPENPSPSLMFDYVFLCFLLGNDFVPNVPFLKIRDGAVDILLEIYKKVNPDFSDRLVYGTSHGYAPNIDMLKEIVHHLANMEAENMEYAMRQYNDTTTVRNVVPNVPENCPGRVKKFLTELEQYPLIHRHPLSDSRGTLSWNTHYYQEFFGSHDIKKYSTQYVDGLMWVLNYYFNRKFDSYWYYKYPVAPLCTDLYKSLMVMDEPMIKERLNALQKNSYTIPITPELQLLCVIPVSSAKILPSKLASIMQDPKYACLHFYPKEYKLCTFMKRFLWECTPILPEIDICHLYEKSM